jgi:hypothetical protein
VSGKDTSSHQRLGDKMEIDQEISGSTCSTYGGSSSAAVSSTTASSDVVKPYGVKVRSSLAASVTDFTRGTAVGLAIGRNQEVARRLEIAECTMQYFAPPVGLTSCASA